MPDGSSATMLVCAAGSDIGVWSVHLLRFGMIPFSPLVIPARKHNCTRLFAGDRPTSEALIVLGKIVIDGMPVGLWWCLSLKILARCLAGSVRPPHQFEPMMFRLLKNRSDGGWVFWVCQRRQLLRRSAAAECQVSKRPLSRSLDKSRSGPSCRLLHHG